MNIRYELLSKDRRKNPPAKVETYGQERTNHVFLADYKEGRWQDPRIVPYDSAINNLKPGSVCLHYGQTVFEGAKAFLHPDGEIYAWRFDKNAARLNESAEIIVMPRIPEDLQMESCLRLLDLERAFCPAERDSAMYIRPFMFGTQDNLGAKPSETYTFCIMLSPSAALVKDGFTSGMSMLISTRYHRAVSGGTGAAKTGGNYAASLRPAQFAYAHGAAQVLYLDASNTYIEEGGVMNHYHVLADGTFIIPSFSDSMLRSVTSLSVLELAQLGHLKARQERVAIQDFISGVKSGEIIEAGCLGTAAVISPVTKYLFEDESEMVVGNGQVGKHSRALYELYVGMQTGQAAAPQGWLHRVGRYVHDLPQGDAR